MKIKIKIEVESNFEIIEHVEYCIEDKEKEVNMNELAYAFKNVAKALGFHEDTVKEYILTEE